MRLRKLVGMVAVWRLWTNRTVDVAKAGRRSSNSFRLPRHRALRVLVSVCCLISDRRQNTGRAGLQSPYVSPACSSGLIPAYFADHQGGFLCRLLYLKPLIPA